MYRLHCGDTLPQIYLIRECPSALIAREYFMNSSYQGLPNWPELAWWVLNETSAKLGWFGLLVWDLVWTSLSRGSTWHGLIQCLSCVKREKAMGCHFPLFKNCEEKSRFCEDEEEDGRCFCAKIQAKLDIILFILFIFHFFFSIFMHKIVWKVVKSGKLCQNFVILDSWSVIDLRVFCPLKKKLWFFIHRVIFRLKIHIWFNIVIDKIIFKNLKINGSMFGVMHVTCYLIDNNLFKFDYGYWNLSLNLRINFKNKWSLRHTHRLKGNVVSLVGCHFIQIKIYFHILREVETTTYTDHWRWACLHNQEKI